MQRLTWAALAAAGIAAGASWAAEDGWGTDIEQAKKEAAERKVPVLAAFVGSDWCGWCAKLEKEAFSTDEFRAFAKENLVLFKADFPMKQKLPQKLAEQNRKLAAQHGIEGFPTVLLLDAGGNVIASTGYRPGGGAAYVKHLQELLAVRKVPAS
jgi:thioredoxin-related protein